MEDRYFKRVYKHSEFYRALVDLIRSLKYFKLKLISPQFKERIMLAVTEVNGCEACSYAHTKFALEEGMSKEEISAILSGDMQNIPQEESLALMYAQHYADTKGKGSSESWLRLVDEYGRDKALVILAHIRMIMVGNIYGMAISGIRDRFKRKARGKTSLAYELSIIFAIFIYFPVALVHAIIISIRECKERGKKHDRSNGNENI